MQADLLLVSVQQRLDAQGNIENRDIPDGALRIHGQNAQGEHANFLVTDPAEVAAIQALWLAYSVAVGVADSQGDPWPAAPHLLITGALAPYTP